MANQAYDGPPFGTPTLAARCADVPDPVPGSRAVPCAECDELCWISPATWPLTESLGGKVICEHCEGLADDA